MSSQSFYWPLLSHCSDILLSFWYFLPGSSFLSLLLIAFSYCLSYFLWFADYLCHYILELITHSHSSVTKVILWGFTDLVDLQFLLIVVLLFEFSGLQIVFTIESNVPLLCWGWVFIIRFSVILSRIRLGISVFLLCPSTPVNRHIIMSSVRFNEKSCCPARYMPMCLRIYGARPSNMMRLVSGDCQDLVKIKKNLPSVPKIVSGVS